MKMTKKSNKWFCLWMTLVVMVSVGVFTACGNDEDAPKGDYQLQFSFHGKADRGLTDFANVHMYVEGVGQGYVNNHSRFSEAVGGEEYSKTVTIALPYHIDVAFNVVPKASFTPNADKNYNATIELEYDVRVLDAEGNVMSAASSSASKVVHQAEGLDLLNNYETVCKTLKKDFPITVSFDWSKSGNSVQLTKTGL